MSNKSHPIPDSDKYRLTFDLIDHPEKYSSETIEEFLNDPEIREIYNLICKTASVVNSNEPIDIDAEWKSFAAKNHHRIHSQRRFSGGIKVASISIICFSSLAAVAVGVVFAISSHKKDFDIHPMQNDNPSSMLQIMPDTITNPVDSISPKNDVFLFEDNSLEEIIRYICTIYTVKATFRNEETPKLHLYFKLDTSLPLDDILKQLNTFERISITRKDNKLIID